MAVAKTRGWAHELPLEMEEEVHPHARDKKEEVEVKKRAGQKKEKELKGRWCRRLCSCEALNQAAWGEEEEAEEAAQEGQEEDPAVEDVVADLGPCEEEE